MARLIKADDLKVEIANYFLSCVDKGKIVIDITEMQVELYKIINSQPTDYDVEWVVKKLQKCSEEYQNSFDEYERGKAFAYSNAISFVKAGGIDGNERTDA